MLGAQETTTTEADLNGRLPPKKQQDLNTGWRAPIDLLEQLDWISDRESGYSRNDVIVEACRQFIAAYEKEHGLTVGRKPYEAKAGRRRGK